MTNYLQKANKTMKITLSQNMFIDYFQDSSRSEQFTYPALEALYNYYESIDEKWELDIIQICCEWTEYDSLEDACSEYGVYYNEDVVYWDIEAELENEVSYFVKLDNGNYLIMD